MRRPPILDPKRPAVPARTERFPVLLIILLVLAATGLRLIGTGNDLWLDEAWSVFITTQLQTPLDVLTLHHEINHPLNTWWLALWGPGAPVAVYHALSLACGAFSVIVAALIGWRRGRAAAWLSAALIGFSYELVSYSAEARGYSALILFTLLSYYLLEGYWIRPRRWVAGAYGVCAILGLLAHPIYAAFLGAATLWGLYRSVRAGQDRGRILRETAICQGIPLLVLAGMYALDYRYAVAGGGTPIQSLFSAAWVALAWAVGAPQQAEIQLILGGAALLGLGFGLWHLYREGTDRWVFFFAVTILFPVALILVRKSDLVYTRHFMVGMVFLLMLWGEALAGLWQRGRAAKTAGLILLAAYAGFNGRHIADWAKYGRGQPRTMLRYIAAQADGSPATIGSDSDFRVGLVVDYYRLGMPELSHLHYMARGNRPPQGPDWMITHAECWTSAEAPLSVLQDARGNRYRWVKTYRTAALSGLHMFLYRNLASPPVVSPEKDEPEPGV